METFTLDMKQNNKEDIVTFKIGLDLYYKGDIYEQGSKYEYHL